MQQYQRSLHGKLAKRLFGLAVFIGIILSAGAYMTTRESIGLAVIERGIAGVTRFNGQYMHLFDQALVPNPRGRGNANGENRGAGLKPAPTEVLVCTSVVRRRSRRCGASCRPARRCACRPAS